MGLTICVLHLYVVLSLIVINDLLIKASHFDINRLGVILQRRRSFHWWCIVLSAVNNFETFSYNI